MVKKNIKRRVQRFDRFGLGSRVETTPQGFIKLPASITRTGVLEYKLGNGDTWRELRLPDEVMKEDSLQTLSGAPVTELHRGMITPENVKEYRVGRASDAVSHDERIVKADLIIENFKTIKGVMDGAFAEVSAGYFSDVEVSPGEWHGEKYDAIQRNIIYNHIAIGPKNWARGGAELKIHMDAAEGTDYAVATRMDSEFTESAVVADNKQANKRGVTMKKITIRLDGINYEIEVPEALAPNFEKSIDAMKTKAAETAERADSVGGELESAKQTIEDLEKKIKDATNPETIERAVKDRVSLVQDCKALDPEIETDGKDARSLKVEALSKHGFDTERFDGKSDAFVDGVFVSKLESIGQEKPVTKSVGVSPEKEHEDSKTEAYDSDAARQRMIERNREAFKTQ